jgi:hypothetical protein
MASNDTTRAIPQTSQRPSTLSGSLFRPALWRVRRSGWPLMVVLATGCAPLFGFAEGSGGETTTASFEAGPLPQWAAPALVTPGLIAPVSPQPEAPQLAAEEGRILGIIPNHRTSPSLDSYKPLTTKEKFTIARQDSFDRGTVALAAVFAGEAQLTNASPSFGQGVKGYAHYLGTSYGDLVLGNYLSEGVFPALLHQDPRYFRRGVGSGWSRLGYSMGQIFWTHTDSGGTQFNYSEILGNASAVAISQAYYPDNRTVADASDKLGLQLGVDVASNVLKEFWPDVTRKFSRKHP